MRIRIASVTLGALAAITSARAMTPRDQMRHRGADQAHGCTETASDACYRSLALPGGAGNLHYYSSMDADASTNGSDASSRRVDRALIVLHGHPRDAAKTFDAALAAVKNAASDSTASTLVVAPVYQVAEADSAKCHSDGVPTAAPGDVLWTCASWIEGAPGSSGGGPSITAFAALDALVDALVKQHPALRTVTIAGFSAGAQMVQHYAAFGSPSSLADHGGVKIRYVVSDPGTWLYFDPGRGDASYWASASTSASSSPPSPAAGSDDAASCPSLNRWKYGTGALPAWLTATSDASSAKARYAAADIHYLEGALDTGDGRGTSYKILDKSCAAQAQGPYRLERGLAYAAYDRAMLAPDKHRSVVIVPDCAHDVACVFPSPAARPALLGD